MIGSSRSAFDRSSAMLMRSTETGVPVLERSSDTVTSELEARPMSDQPGNEGDDQKWSSLIEAASLHRPIVPLPGMAPPVRPAREEPRPAPTPEPIPAPPSPSKLAVPEGPAAKTAPPEPVLAAEPEAATPEDMPEATSGEAADVFTRPEPAPVAIPEVPAPPNPSEEAQAPGVVAGISRKQRRNGGIWLLIALFLLCALIAGAGLLQAARHARKVSQAERQVTTAETSAPLFMAETQAAVPIAPASLATVQPASSTEQAAVSASNTSSDSPASTVASVPATMERPVILYHRRSSSVADRLADQLRPLARQVDVRTATAIPRRPTIRYFKPEDAAAAQALAIVLRRDGGEWRVQGRTARRHRHVSGAVEVWLPDR